jgi:hypothetical protein
MATADPRQLPVLSDPPTPIITLYRPIEFGIPVDAHRAGDALRPRH